MEAALASKRSGEPKTRARKQAATAAKVSEKDMLLHRLDGGDRPQPGDAAGREGAGLGAVSPMPGESGPMGNGEGCTPSDLHQVVAMP